MQNYYKETNKYKKCLKFGQKFFKKYCCSYEYEKAREILADTDVIKFAETMEQEVEGIRQ